jgi:cyclopropane fatty-acyl-phospholipid synthase-like methyltransferase
MNETKYIPENFYSIYNQHRTYVVPHISKKHEREFRKSYWDPCGFKPDMSVLEIGCGTGLFLEFIKKNGITNFTGIDADPLVLDYMPDKLKEKIIISDINDYISSLENKIRFDRVVMIDVLEHFNPQEGVNLLKRIKPFLEKDGGIVVRVPNLASPWGGKWQYHDLTHKAAYTSGSLKQLGLMAGFDCQTFQHRRGNPRKQILENLLYSFLKLIITDPPDLWSSTMVGYFKKKSVE